MNIKMVRRGVAMVAILGVTGVTGIAVANAAPARRPWDGKAPSTSMCQADRKLVKKATIWLPAVHGKSAREGRDILIAPKRNLGEVQLWYSPKCRTAWARVVNTSPGAAAIASVHRLSDNRSYKCEANGGPKICHTAMVNDANVMSFAHGEIWYKGWHGANTAPW